MSIRKTNCIYFNVLMTTPKHKIFGFNGVEAYSIFACCYNIIAFIDVDL